MDARSCRLRQTRVVFSSRRYCRVVVRVWRTRLVVRLRASGKEAIGQHMRFIVDRLQQRCIVRPNLALVRTVRLRRPAAQLFR